MNPATRGLFMGWVWLSEVEMVALCESILERVR
jgi:hypothetical protein